MRGREGIWGREAVGNTRGEKCTPSGNVCADGLQHKVGNASRFMGVVRDRHSGVSAEWEQVLGLRTSHSWATLCKRDERSQLGGGEDSLQLRNHCPGQEVGHNSGGGAKKGETTARGRVGGAWPPGGCGKGRKVPPNLLIFIGLWLPSEVRPRTPELATLQVVGCEIYRLPMKRKPLNFLGPRVQCSQRTRWDHRHPSTFNIIFYPLKKKKGFFDISPIMTQQLKIKSREKIFLRLSVFMKHHSTLLRPRFLKADHVPPRALIKIEVLDHNLPKLIQPVKISQ